jgi:hypothetical protein
MKRPVVLEQSALPQIKKRCHDCERIISHLSSDYKARTRRNDTYGLDLCILGVHCTETLQRLNFALVHYHKHPLYGPLQFGLLKVRLYDYISPHPLTIYISRVKS